MFEKLVDVESSKENTGNYLRIKLNPFKISFLFILLVKREIKRH